MFAFLFSKHIAANRKSHHGVKGPQRRRSSARLLVESLESRDCPALVTVPLNFETPATGSVPQVTTSFGSVELVGYYEPSIIDSDLTAAGHGGTVLQSSPQSNQFGTGRIVVHGGLGTEIRFVYGTRNEVTSPAVQGGITAYTTSQMLIDSGLQPRNEDVFKQFALNQGQPIGPVALGGLNYDQLAIVGDYPNLGLPSNGSGLIDGPGYFNEFVWTSGTFAGDVYSNSRPGATQIDDVVLTVEPAEDILHNSLSFLSDRGDIDTGGGFYDFQSRAGGAGVLFEFKPVGTLGAIPLEDLAAAMGFKRFQWINRVIHLPEHWVANVAVQTGPTTANITQPNIDENVTPLLDPVPSSTGQELYLFTTKAGTPLTLWQIPGSDALPFYYNTSELSEPARIPQGLQRVSDDYRLVFLDQPVQPRSTMNIDTSNPRQGDYIGFETSLAGVIENDPSTEADDTFIEWNNLGTRFVWKSNAVYDGDINTVLNGQVFGFGQSAVTLDPGYPAPPIAAGGIFDVFSDAPDNPNVAPEAIADRAGTAVDVAVQIAVASNDVNPDFGSLDLTSVAVTSFPANGTISVDPVTGVVAYTPNSGFTGTDTFKYTVQDDKGALSNEATVTIRIVQAPAAADDSASTRGTTPVAIYVLTNDSDPDGTLDPTSVAVASASANGSTSVNPTTGAITYTPNAGFAGMDTFTYIVRDSDGVASNAATVTVTVTANQPPLAADDTTTTSEGHAVTIAVLPNDSDPDGSLDPTTVAITTQPANGTVTVNQRRTVTSTDDDGSPVGNGIASALSGSVSAFGRIDLGVSGYSDFDFTGSHAQSGDYSLFVRLGASSFSGFDPAVFDFRFDDSVAPGQVDFFSRTGLTPGMPFIAWIDNTVGSGSPDTVMGTFNVSTDVTYTPDAGFTGTDTFGYTVKDGDGATSNEATVTVTVVPNVPPVANADSGTTVENAPVTIGVLGNDSDTDGTIDFSSVVIASHPANGTAAVNPFTGAVTYTPSSGFIGTDTFTYTVRDDNGDESNTATVTVAVGPNQPPVAVDDRFAAFSGSAVGLNVLANDSDPAGSIVPGTVVLTGLPANGTATINPSTGQISYTPNAGYVGTDTLRYTVRDNSGATSNEAVVTVNVVSQTDFTVTSPTIGGRLPAGATPVGGIVLDLIGVNGVRVVSQLPASSLYVGYFDSGTPAAFRGNPGTIGIQTGFTAAVVNALGGGLSELAVRITLFDGDTGSLDFDDEGQNFLLLNGVSIGDFSDVLTQETDATGTGVLSNNPGGGFRNETLDTGFFYTNDPTTLSNFFATLTTGEVRYQVQDTDPFDNFFDFTQGVDGGLINVGQPPNVRPVANNDAVAAAFNTQVVINVLGNDIDPDGTLDATSVTIGANPANGTVSVDSATGAVTYTPNSGFSGTDRFTYTVKDNAGVVSNVATVTVNVAAPPPAVTDVRVLFGSQSYSLVGNNRTLPWTTITAVQIVFSRDVVIDQNDLRLAGVSVALYGGTFSYDPTTFTATWTLAGPVGRDRLTLSLDGDGAAGDGNDGVRSTDGAFLQGGDYGLGFNVLPGDYNGDGVVTIQDSVGVRDHSPGYGSYLIWADLDGDGDVDINDINAPRIGRLGWRLP